MENFIVSARKYRPETFKSVVGQDSITTTLKNSIKSKHIAHAYLFCGPRGVGKTTCARIFAKTINCLNLNENMEACDTCDSCKAFNKSSSYNIHELDAASNNSVEDIRSLIDFVRVPPQVGKYSVYIIDEVHMLSSQAFNAFLKTLEEPPHYAIFILATTEKHKIIPTILSRCQIYDFHRIEIDDISDYLQWVAKSEGIEIEAEAVNIIAQKADGAMRDALSMFDQLVSFSGNTVTYKNALDNLNVLDYDYYFRLTECFIKGDFYTSLNVFDEILDQGFDILYFISGLSEHLRDLMVCKDSSTLKLLEVGSTFLERYKEQATRFSDNFLFKALDITSSCEINFKITRNKRLHVELMLLKLSKIEFTISNSENKPVETKPGHDAKPKEVRPNEQSKVIESPNRANINNTTDKLESLTKVPSIKNDLKGIRKEVSVVESKNDDPIIKEVTATDFKDSDLNEKWKSFAESIKESDIRLYSTLISGQPVLKEDFLVEFDVNNSLQEESVVKIKDNILNYLRNELHNFKINLKLNISESKNDNKKAFSIKDKFNFLNEKNPNLTKLKQQFNLDFDTM